MAFNPGTKVGEVFVDVVLKSDLPRELAREIAKAQAAAPPIKVEIDTKYFDAQFAALIKAVEGTTATIGVKADTGAARAEIARVTRDETKTVHVRADMNDSISASTARASSGVLTLVALLGPALVPAAAAASAAVLSFGGALLVAGAAAGTTLLAFSGIGNALKAMGNVDTKGAREALALGNTQRGAAAGVANARASLARASASAGDAIAAALRAQAGAERTLASAQRDALSAQEGVNEARRQATADIIDYQLKLRGLAIDERKAAAEVEKARKRLELAKTFQGVPQSIIDRLQLAYDDQVQSLDEVRANQDKTKAASEEASKKGVEGSDLVVEAKQREADANQQVLDAQERLKESTEGVARAQRDGAASVADAQRGVADALDQQAFAMSRTTASANALAEAMANLGPSAQQFATFLYSLKPALKELRETAGAGMFPGMQRGIEAVLPLLPLLDRAVSVVATALGDMFQAMGEWLAAGAGQRFLDIIIQLAPGMIDALGRTLIALGDAFASLFEKTAPFTQVVADGIANLAQSIADFVAGPKFDEIFTSFTDVAPLVTDAIGNILAGLFAIAQALMPAGTVILGILGDIGRTIADMDPEKLEKIVTAVVEIVAVVGAINAVGAAFASIGSAFKVLTVIWSAGSLIFEAVSGFFVALPAMLSAGATALTGIGAAASAAWTAITGPVGLVILAIVGLIAIFVVLFKKNEAFHDAVVGVWDGIKSAIGAVADWFSENVMPTLKSAWEFLLAWWKVLWEGIQFGVDIMIAWWTLLVKIFQVTVWPILKWVIGQIADRFAWLFKGIKWVFDHLKPVFEVAVDVIQWLRDKFADAMDSVTEKWDKFGEIMGVIFDKAKQFVIDKINQIIDIVNRDLIEPLARLANWIGFDVDWEIPNIVTDQNVEGVEGLTVSTEGLDGAIQHAGVTIDEAFTGEFNDKIDAQKEAVDNLAGAYDALSGAVRTSLGDLDLLNQTYIDNQDQVASLSAAGDELRGKLQKYGNLPLGGDVKKLSGEYDTATESGRDLWGSVKNLSKEFAESKRQELLHIEATQGSQAALDELRRITTLTADGQTPYQTELEETFTQQGLNATSANFYAGELAGVDAIDPSVLFTSTGITKAQEDVAKYKTELDRINMEMDVLAYRSKYPDISEATARRNVSAVRTGVANYGPDHTLVAAGSGSTAIGGASPSTDDIPKAFADISAGPQATMSLRSQIPMVTAAAKDQLARAQDDAAKAAASGVPGSGVHVPGGYVLPPGSYHITQSYAQHGYAVDLGAPTGTPVFAPFKGHAADATLRNPDGSYRSYGNYVRVTSGSKQFLGAHLSRFGKTGAVDEGDIVGYVGNTGHSYGSHLHAEIRLNGKTTNPANYIKYDVGGILRHGTTAVNLSRKPEAILTYDQWKTMEKVASAGRGATIGRTGPAVVIENFNASDRVDIDSFMQVAEFHVRAGRV